MKNYYKILGVKQSDDESVIKKAFRKLAKKYHPDNDSSTQAKEKMIEISEAWEVLGNKQKREMHDLDLSGKKDDNPKPFTAKEHTRPDPSRPMTQEDFFRMTQNFENMFSRESIKASVNEKKAPKSAPIDSKTFFENVMGFKV